MADYPALPVFTDALIADTVHLTGDEFGCYMRLLIFAWRTPNCELPDDDLRLRTMLGLTPKRWAKMRPVLMQFFIETEGVLIQKKLKKVRRDVQKKVEQRRNAGVRSGAAKSLKKNNQGATSVATKTPTKHQRTTQQPKPNLSKDKGADDFFEFWEAQIQDGGRVPQTALTANQIRVIRERKNVTEEQIKKAGIN